MAHGFPSYSVGCGNNLCIVVCHEPFWQSQRTLTPSRGRGFSLRTKSNTDCQMNPLETLNRGCFSTILVNVILFSQRKLLPIFGARQVRLNSGEQDFCFIHKPP